MDKPISMSVRDYLVRTLAVKLMVPEKTIDAIIVHQFNEANRAMAVTESIEISGFGKFFFNKKKAEKTMEKYLSKERMFNSIIANPETSEARRQSAINKLNNNKLAIDILKPKINNELFTDLRGMEEQDSAPLRDEGIDYEDS